MSKIFIRDTRLHFYVGEMSDGKRTARDENSFCLFIWYLLRIMIFLLSSKSHLNVTNKNEKCSTFIVKADVHRTENSDIEPAIKSISDKMYFNKKCSKSELDLSTVDDIHIVASESLFSSQTIMQVKQKREKPWSLRIKLRSSENNDSLNGMY